MMVLSFKCMLCHARWTTLTADSELAKKKLENFYRQFSEVYKDNVNKNLS